MGIVFEEGLENRKAPEEVRQLMDVAERQVQHLARSRMELEDFVWTVAHELKAPLRTIKAFSQLLKTEYSHSLDARGRDFLDRLVAAGDRLQNFIDSQLELTRVGRSISTRQSIHVGTLVAHVLKEMEADIQTREVVVRVAPDLPFVQASPRQLAEVFTNLISNGVKFNHSKQVRIEIGLKEMDPEKAVFFVRDNGIGIDSKGVKEIFREFTRLHPMGCYEGVGAGLAIARKIVESHGGKIWAESIVGTGSTFYFLIPLHAREMPEGAYPVLIDGGCHAHKDTPG